MMTPSRLFVSLIALSLLGACGGGGAGPVAEDPPADDQTTDPGVPGDGPTPSQNFSEGATGDPVEVETESSTLSETVSGEDQDVIGLGTIIDPTTGERVLVRLTGTYADATEIWRLEDRIVVLTDDVSGAFEDSDSFIDESETMTGVLGLPTPLDVMPASGRASFEGGAVMSLILPDDGIDFLDGTSTVDVDFDAGTVSATLGNFLNPLSQLNGNRFETPPGGDAVIPIDGLVLTDAVISGSGFSGGVVTTTGNQNLTQTIGGDKRIFSEGQFFGHDETANTPNEVGGLIYAEGNRGQIFGSFIAD